MKKISRHLLRAAVDSMQKRALDKTDILRFLPMIGGGLHGLAKPERGANRAETAGLEGLTGALGGGLGFIGGANIGDRVLGSQGIDSMDSMDSMDVLKAIALLGSSLGTAIGTIPGRALARRDKIVERDELERMIKDLREARGGPGVVINNQPVPVNSSSGVPLEADRESGDELVNPTVTQEA